MAIQHKWYMCGKDNRYIYETPDGGDTIYRRSIDASLEDNDYTNRELVFGQRELGTVADDSIIKEFCESYPNCYELGKALMKYYRENGLDK